MSKKGPANDGMLRNDDVAFIAADGTPVTNRMLDDREERYATGDIGSGWGPVAFGPGMPGGMSKREWRKHLNTPPGRPRLADEPTDVVSFKMPRSLVALIKQAAEACGQTKSKFIREAALEKARKVLNQ